MAPVSVCKSTKNYVFAKVIFWKNAMLSQLCLCVIVKQTKNLAVTEIAILWQDYTKLLMGKRGFIIAIACNLALTG